MDILSYNYSNYSDGSSGRARVPPAPLPHSYFFDQTEARKAKKVFCGHPSPLMSRSGSGTELYLFNNAFVWYSGYKVG